MCDTIIIDAGTAGFVLAARLSKDLGRRILLREAGGPPPLALSIPSEWRCEPSPRYARFLHCGSGFSLFATLPRPESRGEIKLRSADPFAHPVIDPRYFSSDPTGQDLATLVESVKINRAIAATAPLVDVISHELDPSAACRNDDEIAWYVRSHCTSSITRPARVAWDQTLALWSIHAASPSEVWRRSILRMHRCFRR